MTTELKHKEITEKIIGAAFDVHSFLGNGCTHLCLLFFKGIHACFASQEVIYQRALAWEFTKRSLAYEREIEQQIYYRELKESIGTRRADFVVAEKILVALKAVI
jgi:PD-(D/E)XK nuclease superfamily